jgi:hypothetical protein
MRTDTTPAVAPRAQRQSAEPPLPSALAFTVPDAIRLSGIKRTRLYQLIGAGALRAVKSGHRTLVCGESLRGYLGTLPPLRSGKPDEGEAA